MAEAVKVIVRCRPINEREERLGCKVVVEMDAKLNQVRLHKPGSDDPKSVPKSFTFDGVYFMQDHTKQIYDDIGFNLVDNVLKGFNGTMFAYGQTGCGKTYTMMGVTDTPEQVGIIPRAFEHIFDHTATSSGTKFLITASYLEIYNEEVRDLLSKDFKKKHELKEHPEKGVYVQGLSAHKIFNKRDLERVMISGSKNRSTGATLMNVDSSRSHSIFVIDIEMMSMAEDGQEHICSGKLNLVDLAGSERQSKTQATGERLREATRINLSLSALGNVISALVDGKSSHIPYRDSKLTRLLQSSLGGNTKTLMVACVSPADNNYEETLSTLRYANRAKNIKNKPKINEDPKDALLRAYQEEIAKLKLQLMGKMPDTTMQEEVEKRRSSEHEAELAAMREEYERKINTLQSQFGQEQANRTRLEEELLTLKDDYENMVEEAKAKHKEQMATGASSEVLPELSQQAPAETTAVTLPGVGLTTSEKHPPKPKLSEIGAAGSVSNELVGGEAERDERTGKVLSQKELERRPEAKPEPKHDSSSNQILKKDQDILLEHEKAVQKLTELQKGMIGGEKAGDNSLKEQLDARRQHAEEKLVEKSRTHGGLFDDDDDGVLEKIFGNLTDEVRAKTKVLEKTQIKVKAAQEEIADLQQEFEIDRQDYLETIRYQERMLLLQQQLLETMVPLVRRDCNYYNLDRIRSECKFDEALGKWAIPKVALTSGSLATINPVSKSPGHNPSSRKHLPDRDVDLYVHRLQKSEEPDYFKQHRAQELLAECNIVKEGLSPDKSRRQFRVGTGAGPGMPSTGIGGTRLHQRNEAFARPRKLDSLVHPIANTGTLSSLTTPQTTWEMSDSKSQRKKPHHLDPLPDHTKKSLL